MGVKSTTTLTREEAEDRFVTLKAELSERQFKSIAVGYNDTELEDVLEEMNDEVNNGEGFTSFRIGEE